MEISVVRAQIDRGLSVAEAIASVRASALATLKMTTPAHDALLRHALDQLPVNIAILRAPDFRYVYVNHALARLVPEVTVGAKLTESLVGIRGIGALHRVVQTGDPWREEDEAVVIDGELRYFASTYIRLPATAGEPHHVLGIGWDTTEVVLARRRLATSQEYQDESLLESARSSAMIRDLAAMAKSLEHGPAATLKLVVERVARALGADGATFATYADGVLTPRTSARTTRELRWHPFAVRQSPALAEALDSGSIMWLTTSRTRSRSERALMRRLVARTLCCVPVTSGESTAAALLVRWSLSEYQATLAASNFLDITRRLTNLAITGSGTR
jgi:hypothetical protein